MCMGMSSKTSWRDEREDHSMSSSGDRLPHPKRVFALAREVGLESREALPLLRAIGQAPANQLSKLTEDEYINGLNHLLAVTNGRPCGPEQPPTFRTNAHRLAQP